MYQNKITLTPQDILEKDFKIDTRGYRLKEVDSGVVSYKMYRPSNYFELEFHGSILNGVYRLMKLKNRGRDDLWLLTKKSK